MGTDSVRPNTADRRAGYIIRFTFPNPIGFETNFSFASNALSSTVDIVINRNLFDARPNAWFVVSAYPVPD